MAPRIELSTEALAYFATLSASRSSAVIVVSETADYHATMVAFDGSEDEPETMIVGAWDLDNPGPCELTHDTAEELGRACALQGVVCKPTTTQNRGH